MAKVKIQKDRCKGCFLCVVNCHQGLIKAAKGMNAKGLRYAEFTHGACTGCAMCAIICPECIIEVYR